MTAQNTKFLESCLAAPSGQPFTIDFTNDDAGIPHDVAISTVSTSVDPTGGKILFEGKVPPQSLVRLPG